MLLVSVCSAYGQQVRSKVTDAATGRPVWGALVTFMVRTGSVPGTAVTEVWTDYGFGIREKPTAGSDAAH